MNKIVRGMTGIAIVGAVVVGGFWAFGANNGANKETGFKGELVKPDTLTVGLEGTYVPFSYKDKDGKLTGYEVELAEEIAKEMGVKPVFVETKFESLIAGLDANKYDVVMNNMGVTPEREQHYSFAKNYLYSPAILIVKKGSDIKKLSDISGKKSAQTTSSNYGQSALKAGAEIVASPGFAESLELVKNGKADVTLNSDDSWSVYKKENPDTELTAVATKDVDLAGAAPMLSKNKTELTAEINRAEQVLRDNGTMKKLSEKYYGKDLTQDSDAKK